MIVQCPSCSARYRVNEQNIPATGGRISCPSCQHTFIVYPESAAQQAPVASKPSYDGEKTSVATDINSLMAGIGGGFQASGGARSGGDEDDAAATEVISGDALANFNFGGGAPSPPTEDGTVEMQNPFAGLKRRKEEGYDPMKFRETVAQDNFGGGIGDMMTEMTMESSELKTEVASSELLDSISSPASPPPSPSFPGSKPAPPQTPASPPDFNRAGPKFSTGSFSAAKPNASASGGFAAQQPAPEQPSAPPSNSLFPNPAPAPEQPAAPMAAPQASGPPANHPGPWKLKTDFGLTYEFQDTPGLINWMSGRESLDNYELSADGGDFFPWSQFTDIASRMMQGKAPSSTGGFKPVAPAPAEPPAPAGPAASGSFAPMGTPSGLDASPSPSDAFSAQNFMPSSTSPQPAVMPSHNSGSAQPVHTGGASLPSRDAKWNVVLWVMFALLAVGCLALAAHIFGVVDFKAMLGMSPPVTQQVQQAQTPPEQAPAADVNTATEEPPAQDQKPAVSEKDREQAQMMVEDARQEIAANRMSSARQKLETALVLDPELVQTYMLLSEVYEKSGYPDKAKEMKDKMLLLQNKAQDLEMEDDDNAIMP